MIGLVFLLRKYKIIIIYTHINLLTLLIISDFNNPLSTLLSTHA